MPPLTARAGDVIIHKGVTVDGAGYSGFESTGLAERLGRLGIERVGVSGIATEYCVKATALDAVKAGFDTVVLTELIRPVQVGETARVLTELKGAGAKASTAGQWLNSLPGTR
jgi:nicotinamidase/pyrazinamidase